MAKDGFIWRLGLCSHGERLLCCTLLDDTLGDCLDFFLFFDHDMCVVGCGSLDGTCSAFGFHVEKS
jgi:hypothetical protein